jgi:hypothetical protein
MLKPVLITTTKGLLASLAAKVADNLVDELTIKMLQIVSINGIDRQHGLLVGRHLYKSIMTCAQGFDNCFLLWTQAVVTEDL